MPKISSYNYSGPLAYSDRLIGLFGGATNGVSLQQFRDFFGVGTNIKPVNVYPADPADPIYGKNGDLLLVTSTGRIYQRANDTYPGVDNQLMTIQGTRINDAVASTETSWSSDKILRALGSTRNAHLSFAPGAVKVLTYKTRIVIEQLSINRGTNEFSFRLIKSNAAVVGTYTNFGDVNVAISQLSSADLTAGFDIEITYTGAASICTAVYRSVVY